MGTYCSLEKSMDTTVRTSTMLSSSQIQLRERRAALLMARRREVQHSRVSGAHVSAVPLRSCDRPCIWVKLAQGPARISSYKGAHMGWQPIPMTSLHVRDLMSVIRPQPQSEVLRIESGFCGSGSSHKSIVIGY